MIFITLICGTAIGLVTYMLMESYVDFYSTPRPLFIGVGE